MRRRCSRNHRKQSIRRTQAALIGASGIPVEDNQNSITAGPRDYLAWSRPHIEPMAWTAHPLTNTTYDIDGDTAHTETYVMTCVVSPDESEVTIGGARYISRFERRAGDWRLIRQETAMDYRFAVPTEALPNDALRSLRSRADRSYARPLELTEAACERYESGRGQPALRRQ